MDNIYFAVGCKSYDILRSTNTTDSWFEWTEKSRNFTTRMSLDRKTLEWIVRILREAVKYRCSGVRRWKRREFLSLRARNFKALAVSLVSPVSVEGEGEG